MCDYHREIYDNTCDTCKVAIAASENIALPRNYKCENCRKTFTTKTCFQKHLLCNFVSASHKFICEDCDLSWIDEKDLKSQLNCNASERNTELSGVSGGWSWE